MRYHDNNWSELPEPWLTNPGSSRSGSSSATWISKNVNPGSGSRLCQVQGFDDSLQILVNIQSSILLTHRECLNSTSCSLSNTMLSLSSSFTCFQLKLYKVRRGDQEAQTHSEYNRGSREKHGKGIFFCLQVIQMHNTNDNANIPTDSCTSCTTCGCTCTNAITTTYYQYCQCRSL